ncbi:MAG: hypothetical protein NTU62_10095 [Spirochaetes bacterium]|nr:hypothetical protein [Spirochaetota bacterium]
MKARFFCESCGAEVRHSERTCPSCGKTFTAVRCPRCGFEGASKQFARGCPECGYLNVIPPAGEGVGTRPADAPRKTRPRVRAFSMPRFNLPTGFYRVALLVLVGLLLGLVAVLVFVVTGR